MVSQAVLLSVDEGSLEHQILLLRGRDCLLVPYFRTLDTRPSYVPPPSSTPWRNRGFLACRPLVPKKAFSSCCPHHVDDTSSSSRKDQINWDNGYTWIRDVREVLAAHVPSLTNQ